MSNGNLLERYVKEVGRQLPEATRKDVELELRSALEDGLEDRGVNANNPEDQDKVVEFLKEFGKPSKVAASYGARTFLIGPELQTLYWLVLRINIVVQVVIQLVSLIVAAANDPSNFGAIIGGTIGELINGLLVSFGAVTLIFALVDHFVPKDQLPFKGWDPRNLPEITLDHNRLDRAELVIEMFFIAIGITFINLIPGWDFPADLAFMDALVAKFIPFIPWMTVLGVAEVALKVYLLSRGRWETTTRWLELAHTVASVALAAWIFSVAPFTQFAFVDAIVSMSVLFGLTISTGEAMFQLYRLLFPDRYRPFEAMFEDLQRLGDLDAK